MRSRFQDQTFTFSLQTAVYTWAMEMLLWMFHFIDLFFILCISIRSPTNTATTKTQNNTLISNDIFTVQFNYEVVINHSIIIYRHFLRLITSHFFQEEEKMSAFLTYQVSYHWQDQPEPEKTGCFRELKTVGRIAMSRLYTKRL